MMAGRRRKPGVRRQPGGRIDHRTRVALDSRERDMTAVVLEARQRVFGVTADEAGKMKETSFLSRLLVTKEISRRQYGALMGYRNVCEEWGKLHPTKKVQQAADMDRGGGHDNSDGTDPKYVAHFNWCRKRFNRCEEALAETAREDHWARQVVQNVVILGWEDPVHTPSLRIGGNALAHALESLRAESGGVEWPSS